jgi:hypothetical protein
MYMVTILQKYRQFIICTNVLMSFRELHIQELMVSVYNTVVILIMLWFVIL